jgi:hypothetical protein
MKSKILKIIWTDWPSLFCSFAIPIIWLIGIIFPLIHSGAQFGKFEVFVLAIPGSLLACTALLWRIFRIYGLFKHGQLVQGKITYIQIIRDRGRLEFTYTFAGQQFDSWMPIHKNKRVMALLPNQTVDILFDPLHPKRAIIASLFK